jgi:lipopolysaccharide export LptBFGC system permease protein LptF
VKRFLASSEGVRWPGFIIALLPMFIALVFALTVAVHANEQAKFAITGVAYGVRRDAVLRCEASNGTRKGIINAFQALTDLTIANAKAAHRDVEATQKAASNFMAELNAKLDPEKDCALAGAEIPIR